MTKAEIKCAVICPYRRHLGPSVRPILWLSVPLEMNPEIQQTFSSSLMSSVCFVFIGTLSHQRNLFLHSLAHQKLPKLEQKEDEAGR